MNMNKSIALIIVLIAVAGVIYVSNKKAVAPVIVMPDTQKEICYFKETKGEQTTDDAFVSINYDPNGKVHGVINWIPGEKDSLVGAYAGVVEKNEDKGTMQSYPSRLNIVYAGAGEGVVSMQQEIMIVSANEVKTAVGEKFQDKDGVYQFKDTTNLIYENALPMVDCGTVQDRFKKDYSKPVGN